jgi:hypothetical protein
MNRFDQASRYAAKVDGAGFLTWVLGLDAGLVFQDWIDVRSVPFPGEGERTGDLVASLLEGGIGPWWAVAIEFQSEPDPEMFGRLLEYLGRLWRGKRPPGAPGDRYQVGAVVVNLTGRGRSGRDMRAGPLRTCLDIVESNLAEEDAAIVLDGITAGHVLRCVLPWLALMRRGEEPSTMKRWKELAEAEPDARRRLSYGACAKVFAEAVGRHEAWELLLEDWSMKESMVVQEWILEGKAEGKVEGKMEALLQLLEVRFAPGAPPELAARIRSTTDLGRLSSWIRAAATAPSLDDFRKAVESPNPN